MSHTIEELQRILAVSEGREGLRERVEAIRAAIAALTAAGEANPPNK